MYVLVIGALAIALATVAGAYFITRGPEEPAQAKKASGDEDPHASTHTTETTASPRTTRTASTPPPTSTTYTPTTPAAAKPTEYEIKNDLLGEKLAGSGSGSGLKFESLAEFQSFYIVNEWTSGSYLMFEIDMVIKDLKTKDLYDVDVEVAYTNYQSGYVFSGVTGTYRKM